MYITITYEPNFLESLIRYSCINNIKFNRNMEQMILIKHTSNSTPKLQKCFRTNSQTVLVRLA